MKVIKIVAVIIFCAVSASVVPAGGPIEEESPAITIITSEERIPQVPEHVIPEEYFLPPVQQPSPSLAATGTAMPSAYSPFRVPLITELERGMWYVQVAAYTRADNAEYAVNRLGPSYPVAVLFYGTSDGSMFRILIGPFNRAESAAMLQRVKNMGYADAFVRGN